MHRVMPTDIFIVTAWRTYPHLADRYQGHQSIPLSAHDAHVSPHMTAKTFGLIFCLTEGFLNIFCHRTLLPGNCSFVEHHWRVTFGQVRCLTDTVPLCKSETPTVSRAWAGSSLHLGPWPDYGCSRLTAKGHSGLSSDLSDQGREVHTSYFSFSSRLSPSL